MRKTQKPEPTKTYEEIAEAWNVSVVTVKRRMKQHDAKAATLGGFGAKKFPLSEIARVDKAHKIEEQKRLTFAEAA